MQPFEIIDGYMNMPLIVHQCMTREALDVKSTKYFQDAVDKLPTMQQIDLKLLKATSKNTPDWWTFEKGDVAVFTENGDFIGVIYKNAFEKSGLKTGIVHGFVEPPSYDYANGFGITPERRVFIYTNYYGLMNDACGVILFKP